MTKRECAIVMAYTGICMLSGEDFRFFHKYVEDVMGRPVFTHEMGIREIAEKIKEKSREDFLALCENSTAEGCVEVSNHELVQEELSQAKVLGAEGEQE